MEKVNQGRIEMMGKKKAEEQLYKQEYGMAGDGGVGRMRGDL